MEGNKNKEEVKELETMLQAEAAPTVSPGSHRCRPPAPGPAGWHHGTPKRPFSVDKNIRLVKTSFIATKLYTGQSLKILLN